MTPHRALLDLLAEPPATPDTAHGYLDLLGEADQAGPPTGLAQRLMRTGLVPTVYERWWRPALGRVAKGQAGPSMADERSLAVRLLGLAPGSTVLDVACGTGGFTRHFGDAVGPDGLAVGLDASVPMLEKAVAATPRTAPVAYLRADAVRPPLRDASVDAVCCFAALHMFAEPAVALSSFARVLRPGGRVALLTTARHPWQPARAADTVLGALSGQRMFDRDEIANLLVERGFTEVETRFAGVTQFVGATLA
ncbi:class I SAM-dependent methyltransferase [Actinokineospora iranica]|uniref:Ubiquinone/menaquinone biosynthesis C-methylase UbiE n=1 Tax=Actinokineospora iranica TaxID=1271860 RepID=A0A1G6X3P0_9PSEU|nr:methyltransferase domain-containing protein [Actinokineospora iranica]SDD71896.1 Ubiquinone/menaquinone biosynthesis C-methylase UbiE [Actinokineospora iranica]